MQSSSTSFCASFPHPPLVFIGLLKSLTWCHGTDLPVPCKKRRIFFLSFLSAQFIQQTPVFAFSQQHSLGVKVELFTSFNPQILCHISSFPKSGLLYWRCALSLFFLESRFCTWLGSNRSQPAFTNALRCKLSRPANFKCLSLVDAV